VPLLAHVIRSAVEHPVSAYRVLAEVAGRLTTLSEASVRDVPPYDHERPELAFLDLEERIPKLLKTPGRTFARIPLTLRDAFIHEGTIADDRLLEPSVPIYLGVYANVSVGQLQGMFPELSKIASPERLEVLVAAALKGISLRLVQSLPAALPAQAGWTYFQLEKSGPIWEGIAGSRQIAVYAPPEFPGILLELIAVKG
jgi:type VI secretion system protein ImpJ